MNLYFLDSSDKQYLVKENVEEPEVDALVMEDLKTRRPKMQSFYRRTWYDDYFRFWVDYGSHTEFYILQKPEQALNLVEEPAKEKHCNDDYCEL